MLLRSPVSGMAPGVTDVNLMLDDVTGSVGGTEFLLESPGGRFAHVLSDFAADNELAKVDLTLDDEAAETIPPLAAPVSGSYRPHNYDDLTDLSEPVAGIETIDMTPTSRCSTATTPTAPGSSGSSRRRWGPRLDRRLVASDHDRPTRP